VHTHVGVITLGTAFLGVVLMGTLWRLGAAHLIATDSPGPKNIGQAMLFQY
jgi:hypothetical protein